MLRLIIQWLWLPVSLLFDLLGLVLWLFKLKHIPALDNTPSPYKKAQAKAAAKKQLPGTKAATEGMQNVKSFQVGEAKINKQPEYAQYVELALQVSKESNADAAWSFSRFDGKSKTPDLTAWTDIDEYVIQLRGYDTEVKRNNYITVRPLVLEGKKNKDIAEALGKKISWAEDYGAACRLMVKMRLIELGYTEKSPSPTEAGVVAQ